MAEDAVVVVVVMVCGLPAAGNGATRFDGYNDYVDLGPMDVSGSQLTLLGWFKAEGLVKDSITTEVLVDQSYVETI